MININENYLKLQSSYLFTDIGRKVDAFQAGNPDMEVACATRTVPGSRCRT